MEEITQTEKDLLQIVEVTTFLFERSQGLQSKTLDLQKALDESQLFERQLD
jgi:hypothetical protein